MYKPAWICTGTRLLSPNNRLILVGMGAGDNNEYPNLAAFAAILGGSKPTSTVPRLTAPSNPYNALAALARNTTVENPWASLFAPAPAPTPSLIPLIAPPPPTPLPRAIAAAPLAAPTLRWAYVTRRFDQLIDAIGITEDEINDGMKKAMRVVDSLNRAYWNVSSETEHAFLLGSWDKQTRVRPFSDIDVLFVLPWSKYSRFEAHVGNRQSNLLQDVKNNLGITYSRTEIWGDRHVVAAEVDGVEIEVVPAFSFDSGDFAGKFLVCDTKDGGRYKLADPAAERQVLDRANTTYNGNARQLLRLMKKWQIETGAKIKSFQLERLVIEFLGSYPHSKQDRFWYDWMVRDCFRFLVGRASGYVQMPGTEEWIALGDEWLSAAKLALLNATVACNHEDANQEREAGRAWQRIFGTAAPVTVS